MVKKTTRLRFTEDDLSDVKVQKAADRAEKAADKAEKAVDKLASKKSSAKLRKETSAGSSRKAKLRFEKAEVTEIERLILSILVYTFFSRMFDLMLPPVAKHSIVVA